MTIKSMRQDLASTDSIAQAVGAAVTANTGGATNSYTSSGITYDSWTWTSNGSFSVAAPCYVDLFLCGGGAAGGIGSGTVAGGGGGGGQFAELANVLLPFAGSYTVAVGSGGAGNGDYGLSLIHI